MLGFIPAKGTSKGLPGKNKRLLNGKPLVAYSIEAALASSLDRVFVSTDDEDIAAIAKNCGLEVPFLRPASLSGDTDTIEAALSYTLDSLFQKEGYKPKDIVLLQPTSPLRTTTHINEAVALFHSTPESVLSVSDPMEHPAEMVYWKDGKMNFCLESILPGKDQRQSYPHYYFTNGALYLFSYEQFIATGSRYSACPVPYPMSQRSSIDIDTEDDFCIAEALLKAGF